MPRRFLKWWDMIRVSPQLIKLEAYRSVYSKVASFIKDDRLRQAFSFSSLLIGGNPYRASSILHSDSSARAQMGGVFQKGELMPCHGLVRLFEDLGGRIELDANVEDIITDENSVAEFVTTAKISLPIWL